MNNSGGEVRPYCPMCFENDEVDEFLSSFSHVCQGPTREGWFCDRCKLSFGFNALGRDAYRDSHLSRPSFFSRLKYKIKVIYYIIAN